MLACAQSTSYRDRLNNVLADGQPEGKYVEGVRVRVLANGYSIHIGDADSDEERRSRTLRLGANDDDVELLPPPARPVSSSFVHCPLLSI